jgi:hypothetical protein
VGVTAADPQQHAAQPAVSTSPPPPHQSRLAEFLRTRPTTFSQAKDPIDAEDWLKGVEKKLVIAQCTDREKVRFAAHQLYGTAANWWEMYCNNHANVDTVTWNEFKACFRTHYVPHGTMKHKRKEFADLKQWFSLVCSVRSVPGEVSPEVSVQITKGPLLRRVVLGRVHSLTHSFSTRRIPRESTQSAPPIGTPN